MSWAWNSVIGDEEEESQADDDDPNNSQNSQKNAEKLILSVGIYLRTGSILIKSEDDQQERYLEFILMGQL